VEECSDGGLLSVRTSAPVLSLSKFPSLQSVDCALAALLPLPAEGEIRTDGAKCC